MTHHDDDARHCRARRALLRRAGVALLATTAPAALAAARADDPRRLPPQPGDELAYPSYEHDGRPIAVEELVAGAAPLLAYPRDPASGVLRERSRLNQILVLRVAADALDGGPPAHAVDGILAYSGVCTHTACGVSEWDAVAGHLVCPCHGSAFDPRAGGRRVTGPAPRALPALPIGLANGRVVVAGAFTARVGAPG